jgi:hypothetical protein
MEIVNKEKRFTFDFGSFETEGLIQESFGLCCSKIDCSLNQKQLEIIVEDTFLHKFKIECTPVVLFNRIFKTCKRLSEYKDWKVERVSVRVSNNPEFIVSASHQLTSNKEENNENCF